MRSFMPIASICLITAGCFQELDRKIANVREQAYTVNEGFCTASAAFVAGADQMAAQKHQYQKLHIDNSFDRWLDMHTDAKGQLVSQLPDGRVIPLSKEQLKKEIERRDAEMVVLQTSMSRWEEFKTTYVNAIEKFRATNELLKDTEADAVAAKESLQAQMSAAAQVIGSAISLASGLPIGMGIK